MIEKLKAATDSDDFAEVLEKVIRIVVVFIYPEPILKEVENAMKTKTQGFNLIKYYKAYSSGKNYYHTLSLADRLAIFANIK